MPGSCDARSLNPCHTKWLLQYGQPASCFVRAYTAVCHVCPLAHCHHTLFPLAAVTLSGVRSPFRSAAHSSRRCILPVLRQYVYKDSLMIPHSSASLNSLFVCFHAKNINRKNKAAFPQSIHFFDKIAATAFNAAPPARISQIGCTWPFTKQDTAIASSSNIILETRMTPILRTPSPFSATANSFAFDTPSPSAPQPAEHLEKASSKLLPRFNFSQPVILSSTVLAFPFS